MEPCNGTNCAACANLVRLCSGLDFFPADVVVRRLLVDALHCLADDHHHAKLMIARWLETETIAPKVANFKVLAGQVRSGPSMPDGCGICDGAPFVIRDYEFGGTGYSAADRCTCPRGEALRQLDRTRGLQEKVKKAAKNRLAAFIPAIAISDDFGGITTP